MTAHKVTKNSKEIYSFPNGKKQLRIINGNDKYLDAKGSINIESIGTFKKAKITFTDC